MFFNMNKDEFSTFMYIIITTLSTIIASVAIVILLACAVTYALGDETDNKQINNVKIEVSKNG